MSVNQPDDSLQVPQGSPLGASQAPNLPEDSRSSGLDDRASRLNRAQAEYEAWLSKKEEREAGVGQPHDYGTRDWAAKGRVPARPSALTRMESESSSMAQMQPVLPYPSMQYPPAPGQSVHYPSVQPSSTQHHSVRHPSMHPPPIMVRAVSTDRLAETEDPVLITPSNGSPNPQMVYADPAFLHGLDASQRRGGLSTQTSFDNLHAAYDPQTYNDDFRMSSTGHPGQQYPHPEGYPGQEYPFPQQPYPYSYNPTYGYGYDPAIFQQQFWSQPSWYAPQYDWNNAAYGSHQAPEEAAHLREA